MATKETMEGVEMNEEEMEEFMKRRYPDLVDFNNLQFVKDCEEEGVKKYKQKVKEVIMRNLGIEETPTDGIWKHNSELKMEDIKKIFKELGLE